ncbi:MAG: divalent-cation tolerance protein CutA [Verrucomicrobia bacterium]|nr:divalent-cation tolerance protein CutA [Verrucomicrobiota bacterium]MBU4292169.1 divalent-cation tolerance protein CutA [Verrucomicrobiota bacterium]MBU4429997.1 divalent-cation tolerance protein CutA [Verrucomicrobiota bacterium]MCG2681614.1 divalent-cation tolerance protein CutA [Kiritimatiellia bacterium]
MVSGRLKNKKDGKTELLVIVNTTVASKAEAQKLAGAIIKSRLAACVQFMPIHSIYRWKGRVESAPEYLVLAKTRAALAAPLMAFIKRHHPYEVPEILVTPITAAYGKYHEWVETETKMIAHRNHGRKSG